MMRPKRGMICALAVLVTAAVAIPTARAETVAAREVVKIWPGPAPGAEDWKVVETDRPIPLPGAPELRMVTNVAVPTLTVFRPAAGKATGAAMIVAPGGGFQAMAVTHEGTMVAQWLADRGVTAFVLKYRVRPMAGFHMPPDVRARPERFDELARFIDPGRKIAVADGLQAIRYLRANASAYGISPDRIGFMGFSAGGMTTMGVILDAAPAGRPNFAAPIYGAMEDITPPKDGPPLFIVAAQDDPAVPVAKSLAIFTAWTAANLPAELHVFETGGHGFGILKRGKAADDWPVAFDAWLTRHGWATGASKAP